MDIINPEIIVFGKRYYRSNAVLNTNNNITESNNDYYEEEPCEYDVVNSNYEILQKDDIFTGFFDVPSMFICFVIGKGGEAKKRIEFDTKTNLAIPKMGSTGQVIVTGKYASSVDRALTRIAMLVENGRSKSQFTHFLSVPANLFEIQQRFEAFKVAVLHGCVGDRGVEEAVFQRTYKLHVTISVLVLGDQGEVDHTMDVCRNFRDDNEALFLAPLVVRVRGIGYMNDDPCETRVLYAKLERGGDADKLQTIADQLVDNLVDRRVIRSREHETVTLHMTLINGSFRQDEDLDLDNFGAGSAPPRTVDCSNILKKFAGWDFGELCVEELQLSRRLNVHPGSYYQSVGSLAFGRGR